jgi:hypothetical protein
MRLAGAMAQVESPAIAAGEYPEAIGCRVARRGVPNKIASLEGVMSPTIAPIGGIVGPPALMAMLEDPIVAP